MAASNYRIDRGANAKPSGLELADVFEALGDAFARLERHRDAMIQQRDSDTDTPADHVTTAEVYGFLDATGQVDEAVAHEAFLEIDSLAGNAGPAITQACARFKQ